MVVDPKVVEKYIENFCTTTVIRVFNFIRTSSFALERIFWILVLVSFTTATIWSVTATFRVFDSQPTASQVFYVSNASNGLNFVDAVLCLEVREQQLLKLYDEKADEIVDFVSTTDFAQVLKRKLKKNHELEDERVSAVKKLNSSFTLPALLTSFHSFDQSNFNAFSSNEVALLGLSTAMFVRLIDIEAESKPIYPRWPSVSVEKLYQAFVRIGTNFSDLFTVVAEMTCALFQLRISRAEYISDDGSGMYRAYNLCKHSASSISYFGIYGKSQTICYNVAAEDDESPLSFYTEFDRVAISIHPETLYKHLVAELKHITVDLGGTYAAEQSGLAPKFNTKQVVDFSFETVSTAANLRRRECAEKSKRKGGFQDCIYWCRLESIVKACDCMPLFGRFVPRVFFEGMPEVNTSCAITIAGNFENVSADGQKCGVALAGGYYDTTKCSQPCKHNCETLLFMSTIRPSTSGLDDANVTTVVGLKSIKFAYQKVDEYISMDFWALIAALGGNLSLYLGASFLALIHMVVFVVRIPFEERRSNAVTEKNGEVK